MKQVPQSIADYAAKFGVGVAVERYGIYGDEWDWVANPAQPTHYPNVKEARAPISTDAKAVIRTVAERMGTGRADFHGFKVAR